MLMRRLLFSAALLAILAQAVYAREWTDATGRFKTEAELVKVEANKAFLKKQSDGATIQVPIAKLSQADQAYLKTLESPAPELTATGQSAFPLGTAGCIGLMVIDPSPVFEQEALSVDPLKPLLEQGVEAAGIDFRKIQQVVVFFNKPNMEALTPDDAETGVAVVEFSEPVDPAPVLAKIPTEYEATTVADKPCHKPADADFPWICVLDEKTFVVSPNEKSLTSALSAKGDDPDLAQLLKATGEENEIRYVINLVPVKDMIAMARNAIPPTAPPESGKIFDVVEKIDSIRFTVDLDGPPAVELVLQAADEAAVAAMETEIKAGLAKLPELAQAGMQAAAAAQAAGGEEAGVEMGPAMMAGPMIAAQAGSISEKLAFEPQGSALKISIKFSPGDAPLGEQLVEQAVQTAEAIAMLKNMEGSPFGTPPQN